MQRLPDELLSRVLWCVSRADITSARGVCKTWRELMGTAWLRRWADARKRIPHAYRHSLLRQLVGAGVLTQVDHSATSLIAFLRLRVIFADRELHSLLNCGHMRVSTTAHRFTVLGIELSPHQRALLTWSSMAHAGSSPHLKFTQLLLLTRGHTCMDASWGAKEVCRLCDTTEQLDSISSRACIELREAMLTGGATSPLVGRLTDPQLLAAIISAAHLKLQLCKPVRACFRDCWPRRSHAEPKQVLHRIASRLDHAPPLSMNLDSCSCMFATWKQHPFADAEADMMRPVCDWLVPPTLT